jgi:hypothetical protein
MLELACSAQALLNGVHVPAHLPVIGPLGHPLEMVQERFPDEVEALFRHSWSSPGWDEVTVAWSQKRW